MMMELIYNRLNYWKINSKFKFVSILMEVIYNISEYDPEYD